MASIRRVFSKTLEDRARPFARSATQSAEVLERIPIPYLELDAGARILRTNVEGNRILDPTGKPVLGKSLYTFVSDEDLRRLRAKLAVCGRSGTPSAVDVSIVRKKERLPVELRLGRALSGKNARYAAVLLNRATPSPLSKDMTTLRHDFVLELSRAESFTSVVQIVAGYCNLAFESQAGMIYVEHDGKLQLVLQWPHQIAKKDFLGELIGNGPVMHAFRTSRVIVSSRKRSPGKNRFGVRNSALVPITAPDEPPIGVIVLFLPQKTGIGPEIQDELSRLGQIAAGAIVRARAYDEALAACARAEDVNHHQEEFLSVISHELRNPMMPILNWAIALSSGSLPPEKQSHAVEAIIRNVRALNYLLDDLFDVARISAGKLSLNPAEMRIQEVAREALTVTQQTAENKKLRIATDISEGVPPFFADARRVRQVLINVLNNAVKFTPSGGLITLKVARRGNQVECTITDTGKGIDAKFLPFVFDRFQQENRSIKTRGTGLGLGLAIVREIIELHGGSVKAHSRGADQGATVVLRLPLAKKRLESAYKVKHLSVAA